MSDSYPVKVLSKNIVANDNGEILTLKRSESDTRRPGCWDFPGGGKDAGEDIYQSAIRETKEEAGLEVNDLQIIYVESGMGVKDQDVLALCFLVKKWAGAVNLSSEHSEFSWIEPGQFLELETGNDGGFLHNCVQAYLSYKSKR